MCYYSINADSNNLCTETYPMRLYNYFTLVGAVALVITGVDAFTLGRNVTLVIDDDSHETTTDNLLLDSAERNQTSSTEDDSLEVVNRTIRLVVKRNPLGFIPSSTDQLSVAQPGDHQQPSVRVHDDYSWEDLIENIAKLDVTEGTVGTETTQHQQQQHFVIHDDSLEDLHHIRGTAQKIGDANLVAVQQPSVPQDTSRVLVIQDDYDDDFSLEDYTEFVNADAVQLTATDFHHLPVTLFNHPTSDDWFLVKHFMDDHYVWELGDELAKEYFWQPVKASDPQPQTVL